MTTITSILGREYKSTVNMAIMKWKPGLMKIIIITAINSGIFYSFHTRYETKFSKF